MRTHLTLAAIAAFTLAPAARGQDLAARLDSVMKVAERNGFSGVVQVEKDGRIVLERGYGYANRARKVPFTPRTVVQIGSNTKDFTAVAILQLFEAGRLALADPISRYFPNAPADKRGITIQQLLDHRAGFPPGLGGDFEVLTRTQLVDSAMRTPLRFTPGARESYSNTGFSLLAAIIEQVTGKTYDEYVRDAILAPLGLTRTGFHLPGFALTDLAHGYLAGGQDAGTMLEKPHAADGPYWNLRGNGGMLSTVGDMHTFYKALFETERLMKASTRALRFDVNAPIGLAGSDGVNFFLYERIPPARTEIIIASTNAAARAPMIRRELGRVLGLPDPDGPRGETAKRPGGRPAAAPLALVITQLVATINSGNKDALRRFITDHFTSGPDEPTVDERLERIGRVHENLGVLKVRTIEQFDTGPIEVTVDAETQGLTVIRVNIDTTAPYRIHALQIRVGG